MSGLVAVFVVERWRAILKAWEGRHLIRTGFPRSAISFKILFKGFLLLRSEILLALGLLFFRAPPMITIIKGSQRGSTSF